MDYTNHECKPLSQKQKTILEMTLVPSVIVKIDEMKRTFRKGPEDPSIIGGQDKPMSTSSNTNVPHL